MNDLIPLTHHDDGTVAVSMRNLHAGLDIATDFTDWAKRMFAYGFEDGTDYTEITADQQFLKNGEMLPRPRRDWALTLDAAKEVAMIQRTERGQQVRRYFIAKEKELRQRPVAQLTEDEIVHQALAITSRKVKELEATVAEQAPKADAYDAFMDADGCYSIGTVAKMLGKSQNRLFDDLRAAGVLISKGHMRNTPYQQYARHFRVNAASFERKDGTSGSSHTTKVRPSGIDFIRRKLGMASAPMLNIA